MRWLNNNKHHSSDDGEGSCHIENTKNEKELIEFPQPTITHSDRPEGKRRFSLFRRRRSDIHAEDGENELSELLSSESDQDGPYVETSAASIEDSTTPLDCGNEDIYNTVDERSSDADQSNDTKEDDSSAKFNWFGLLKNNPLSREDSESSVYHATSAEAEEDCTKSLDRVDSDTIDDDEVDSDCLQRDNISYSMEEVHEDSTKPIRFNWFGLLQPSQSASSCMENYSSVIQQDEDEEEVDEKDIEGEDTEEAGKADGDEDEMVCSGCSKSSAEFSSYDSMDTDDIVIEISDDERLQDLFEKCSSQHQQEQHQHPLCNDNLQCDANVHVSSNDNDESEFFVKKEAPLSGEILALWQRRQRLKRKLQFDIPIHETPEPTSVKMIGTAQLEAGGGRNEENLRSLELESHLIDTSSDRKMTKMDIMSTEEKVREDLLHDMFLQYCLLMAGEEPHDGWDNLGWYSTLTQREDGEADLEYMNTSTMKVAKGDDESANKSNRWLDGIGNAALFVFAPELYFIQQMNESSLETQYHPASNKEDGEPDVEQQKQGWFRRMLSNEGGRKD